MTDKQQTATAMAANIDLPESPPSISGVFDNIEALKLAMEEVGIAGSTEVMTTVPVRKPRKHEYFRVRPGKENCFTTVVYEDQENQAREYYFVTPKMIPVLRKFVDVSVVTLVQYYTKQKVFGILPLRIATDANRNSWHDTAMVAAEHAKTKWVRMQADMALGGYRIFTAEGDLGEPEWPEAPFNELLDLAFKDRVIASEDHPVLNKVRGRV